MTLVQMQPRSATADPVHLTVDGPREATGPQVGDDMTVEVALAVMASARTGHLLVRDDDGLCTGLLTRAQLAAVRESPTYTDRVRLRDVLGERGPFASPAATRAEGDRATGDRAMRFRRLDALPGVGEQESAPGVLALAR
ncbi:CBS domain-containing protein [Streptomyces sp. NPDC055254]